MSKSAIVTGAAGFVGYYLTKTLSESGYTVYALVRPDSFHNVRISNLNNVRCIEVDLNKINLTSIDGISVENSVFFHLAWEPADRYDYLRQMKNAYTTIRMLDEASRIGCSRFVGIGSQAEYGLTMDIIDEDTLLRPFCGYGAAKVAACYMSAQRAKELNIEWVWGRIFSVYGRYEPKERLIPYIIKSLETERRVSLSSCRQNWDFLFGSDAGKAILAMAERGKNGEIYNIADGRYRCLKDYVSEVAGLYKGTEVVYGKDPDPFVSLRPSVEKLRTDTGWSPMTDFIEGIKESIRELRRDENAT